MLAQKQMLKVNLKSTQESAYGVLTHGLLTLISNTKEKRDLCSRKVVSGLSKLGHMDQIQPTPITYK